MNGRERLMAHLDGNPVDCLPVMPITMMFAGDHLGVKYGEYVTDFRKLVEAQVKIADDYDFDFVSCISDPAREAADCGAHVEIFPDQPPAIVEGHALLADKNALPTLDMPDPFSEGRMVDRIRAAELFRQEVGDRYLLEGWIEGPCAEAADLRGINTLMMDFFDDPDFIHELFEFTLQMGLQFARAQVEAGVDLIGVGDAAASLVGPQIYEQYVWSYEKRLVEGLHDMGARVRMHICGNINAILEKVGQLNCEIVDLDFMVSVADARQAMGEDQILLGNIDPVRVLREGTPDSVTAAIAACHHQAGPRYIVGAGCEVPRGTPPENLRALTEYARRHTP
jgi:MtaA/CmuA family methyltransferase